LIFPPTETFSMRIANLLLVVFAFPSIAWASDTAAQVEFFEKKVRPVLVEHCYSCHSAGAKKLRGGLHADSRAALLKGGDTGPALVPGAPEKSRLIAAIRYKDVDLQMPPRAKLPDAAIADLTAWVKMGAPWPAEKANATAGKGVFDLARRQREHWCWQPLRGPQPPNVKDTRWPLSPVDRFLLARLEEKGLRPAAAADPRVLVRRLYFDLIGLPPSAQEVEAFAASTQPQAALTDVVDRLLGSEHFGERWGRHWLDLVRYAESRGHEFDYRAPNAFQYRDYVIRALNADVPYRQFAIEHLAGDLLTAPRLHPKEGFNESILGTGFWFLGEQLHSPVDICQDKADRFDNMVDVMSKAFLGLTVACARCHDHKFDAISTKDYYALCGFLESSSYRLVPFDSLEHNRDIARQLWQLRERSRPALQRAAAAALRPALLKTTTYLEEARKIRRGAGENAVGNIKEVVVDYARPGREDWLPDGFAFGPRPSQVGELHIEDKGGRPVLRLQEVGAAEFDVAWDRQRPTAGAELEPGAVGTLQRPGLMLRTPTFQIKSGRVYYLVRGNGRAYAAVEAHGMISGPLHGKLIRSLQATPGFRWIEHDLTPYQGRRAHVEFTPAPGSNFAVAQVVQADRMPEYVAPFGDLLPANEADSADAYQRLFLAVVDKLAAGRLSTASEAALVNWMLHDRELFPAAASDELTAFLAEQAKIVAQIKADSRLAPALLDGNGVDEHVFIRGSYKAPGVSTPRRFLEALAGPQALGAAHGSGRLELARQLTDPERNPLLPRVLVNRVWHHLFGHGIVGSVDNFGVLGETPSHPELLDYLAERFVADGWSLKKLIRALVLTRAYQMSSQPSAAAQQADPTNRLLHRANVRRLEGEVIRDAMLAISGRFDPRMYGPAVPVHLTDFQQGRGRPASGPLDGAGRRSVYLSVHRNFLAPFLLAFDTPTPFSTVGKRTVSNVPAQALILLNDPFVHEQARLWAQRAVKTAPAESVRGMYLSAFSRPPDDAELRACLAFIDAQSKTANDGAAWTSLAHALFNAKEFIFLP
jgi:cytochrome c553